MSFLSISHFLDHCSAVFQTIISTLCILCPPASACFNIASVLTLLPTDGYIAARRVRASESRGGGTYRIRYGFGERCGFLFFSAFGIMVLSGVLKQDDPLLPSPPPIGQ